jgi:serine/threonine protein kinase/CheY-like chemotaxis protein
MKRIGDRFVLEAPLGSGGMGSIFRGRDERLGQAVAIKILKRAHLEDPILRERFRREALSLARIRHPGVVSVLDFGETDEGDPYTVLALVPGETLERLITQTEGRGMPLSSAGMIADAILSALDACHESGIVHRDIKPSNVIVGSGSALAVTLIDFGLAHVAGTSVEKLTETGTVQGTPAYMAPEQCRGEEVGPEADVYAAGLVVYEILAGEMPFHGTDGATFMAQHLFVDPRPLREVAPVVPVGIAAAIHAALAKRPEQRPTARELQVALAAAASGTDRESRAADAASLRHQVASLPRSERTLPAGDRPVDRAEVHPASVVVWVDRSERRAALRACLGTAGLVTLASGEPPETLASDRLVVLSARDGIDRVRRLRKLDATVPILLVDVAGPDETTEAIRAGANDMLLAVASDADLAPKVRRLLRRGRR